MSFNYYYWLALYTFWTVESGHIQNTIAHCTTTFHGWLGCVKYRCVVVTRTIQIHNRRSLQHCVFGRNDLLGHLTLRASFSIWLINSSAPTQCECNYFMTLSLFEIITLMWWLPSIELQSFFVHLINWSKFIICHSQNSHISILFIGKQMSTHIHVREPTRSFD